MANDNDRSVSALSLASDGKPKLKGLDLLRDAIKRKLEELKISSMGDLSDATPYFSLRTFIIAYIYHFTAFMLLGPMTGIFVAMFSGLWYSKNCAFLPNRAMMMFWMIQTMSWMCIVIPIGMVIYSKIRYDEVRFSYFPLALMIGMATFRCFIIAIRHSTTPPRIYRDMYT